MEERKLWDKLTLTGSPIKTPLLGVVVNCVKKGVSTASLKKVLGHDRLETTEIYLNICPEDALSEFFHKVEGSNRRRRH
jgi:hypothetical protein